MTAVKKHIDFMPTDTQYHVDPYGLVTLQRQISFHDGLKMFSVHAWDSSGKKHTAVVRVKQQDQASLYIRQQKDVDEIMSAQVHFIRSYLISDGQSVEFIALQIRSSHFKETKTVYSITGEGADQPPVGLFTIDKNTGWLYVSMPLDRETREKYELFAHAHSAFDAIKEPAIAITVEVLNQNDNIPVFTQNLFIGNVPEMSKIVQATDADGPDNSFGDIRYSIISQNPPTVPSMFPNNPVSGAIQVNADGLDREKYPEYTLQIGAADMQGEGRQVIAKAIITITESKSKSLEKLPWLIPPIRISENDQGPFPKEIAQIKSSHAKITKVMYIIGGSEAGLPPEALFFININTGQLFVSRPLDRKTKKEYALQVHLCGENINDEFVEFIIHVADQNDNKPVFTQNPFIGSVSGASKIRFSLMTISATDADDLNTENADIRYSIISQIPPELTPNMFVINPVNGVIRVNDERLDFLKYSKYVLKIQAADMQGNALSSIGDAVIHVIDYKSITLTSPGMWEISPICFPENDRGPYPKKLTKIRTSHATQAKIMFHITGEGAEQPPVGLFTVDKDEGWLSVTQPLDREKKHQYVFQAQTVVDGIKEQPTEITICVIDQNDNKPVFIQDPFLGSVPEKSKIGFGSMTISASDADDPKTENAIIRYSIISQDPALPQQDMFEINPISEVIQVKTDRLDKEKYSEYTLEIQAADMHGYGLQSRGKAIITVTV
ncbi:Cadherin-1 [Bagarius yarrelli]|uniref:Cadherin-1 n=1 Tax=Bagarius yarrelli TaxID=175774 RepID=A0A556VVN9_BAGYA|nr:Cadherin-1 [Bagarius yarrelli]